MVRPRRIVFSGGYYHLYNRFVSGLSLFYSKNIVDIFFDEFLKQADKFGINVFILYNMPNHFHSFIQITEKNLSEFIQRYSTNFARKINKITNRKGHVFQGRHKTQLVETDRYLYFLTHYIFNNAKRAGIVEKVEDYKWSNLDDIIKNYKTNKNYKWLIDQIIDCKIKPPVKFLEWLNEDLKNIDEEKIVNKIEGQFLMDAIPKKNVFEKIDRRSEKSINADNKKRRKEEVRDLKKMKWKLNKSINEYFNNYVNKSILEWRTERIAKQHILWYIMRETYNVKLKEICSVSNIYRHQTVSQAISCIKKEKGKKKVIKEIVKYIEN